MDIDAANDATNDDTAADMKRITASDLIDINNQLEIYQDKRKSKKLQKKDQVRRLTKAYNEGNLVFILGSGVCISSLLPNWNTLLQKLLLKIEFADIDSEIKSQLLAKTFNKIFNPNQLIAARYIKKHYEKNVSLNRIPFEDLIKNALYEDLDVRRRDPLFEEIMQFCVGHRGPKIDCIITYNYDDLLEKCFEARRIPYRPIYSAGVNPSRRDFPIYHVHGFLPQNDPSNKSSIILSEDMYHHRYNEIYNWSNLLQINKFTDKTCLFMGFSLEDPNSRRLLDIAAKQRGNSKTAHYIIRKRIDPAKVETKLKNLLTQDYELFDEKISQGLKLSELVQRMILLQKNFLEEDSLSFGIETIWIDDYKDIPTLLNEIRKDDPN